MGLSAKPYGKFKRVLKRLEYKQEKEQEAWRLKKSNKK